MQTRESRRVEEDSPEDKRSEARPIRSVNGILANDETRRWQRSASRVSKRKEYFDEGGIQRVLRSETSFRRWSYCEGPREIASVAAPVVRRCWCQIVEDGKGIYTHQLHDRCNDPNGPSCLSSTALSIVIFSLRGSPRDRKRWAESRRSPLRVSNRRQRMAATRTITDPCNDPNGSPSCL